MENDEVRDSAAAHCDFADHESSSYLSSKSLPCRWGDPSRPSVDGWAAQVMLECFPSYRRFRPMSDSCRRLVVKAVSAFAEASMPLPIPGGYTLISANLRFWGIVEAHRVIAKCNWSDDYFRFADQPGITRAQGRSSGLIRETLVPIGRQSAASARSSCPESSSGGPNQQTACLRAERLTQQPPSPIPEMRHALRKPSPAKRMLGPVLRGWHR